MPSVLTDSGRDRVLRAMLAGMDVPFRHPTWMAEVEVRAEWYSPGSRWQAFRRLRLGWQEFWDEFFAPSPIRHEQVWRTEQLPVTFQLAHSGLRNATELRWDLQSLPPAPTESRGWEARWVNVFDGDTCIFVVPTDKHVDSPTDTLVLHPGSLVVQVSD